MKKIILSLVLLTSTYWSMAQSPTLTWAKQLSSTTVAIGNSITSDPAGNVYTAGRFGGTLDLDPGVGSVNVVASGSLNDLFISKVDANGAYVWGQAIGGASSDVANGVAVDASGNVYVTGSFSGAVDFDPGAGVTTLTSNGGLDIFILKLDASGNFVWANAIGGTGADEGLSIAVDGSGNVYTAGYFNATADFDPGAGTTNLTSAGGTDAFEVKLNTSGNYQWVKQIGSTGVDQINSVVVDASGRSYIAIAFQGTLPAGMVNAFAISSAGSTDGLLLVLNTSGTVNGGGALIGSGGDDAITALALDAARNAVYLTGRFSGNMPVYNYTNAGGFDLFVQQFPLDAVSGALAGPIGWGYGFGVGGNQEGLGIDVDPLNGNVAVCGYIRGAAVDFDPSSNNTFLSATGASQDGFIANYSSAGAFRSAFTVGNANFDQLSAIDAFNLSLHTTGYFQGTVDVDPVGTTNLISGSTGTAFDAYILKYSTCTPPPMPTNITPNANQTICAGNSTTLQVTGIGTLSWYATATGSTFLGAGPNFTTPVLTTSTTYYAQDSTCYFGTRRPIVVTVSAIPNLVANASATSLCYGDMLTLFGSGAQTYSWNNSVSNNVPFAATIVGTTTYIVNGVSASGCMAIADTVVVTVNQTASPGVNVQYVPLSLTGFNNDIVANGNNFLTSTTTSVDANSDGCRFIEVGYTQFGTPTRFLPTGGAFTSQTTPGLPFQFASYTANNSLTLFTAGDTGVLTLTTPMAMNQFYLLATSGGGVTNIDGVIRFSDGSTENMPNLNINDWFNAPNYALQGVGRMYNNALGFQAPTDVNPRIYQFAIAISPANQSKTVTSITFTRNNLGSMKTQIMGITAQVTLQEFCASSNPTVANLVASGSAIQWYDSANVLLANTVSLVDGDLYYATQTLNGCESEPVAVLASFVAPPVVTVNSPAVCIGSSVSLNASGADTYSWSTGGNTSSISVSPTTTTSYTVTATDTSSACSTSVVSTVSVNALPTVTASANPATVCLGATVTLTGAGANSYSWTGGPTNNVAFTPSATATYTVTGTDNNGCTNTATQLVTVNALPTVTFTPFGNALCSNGPVLPLLGGSPAGGTYSGAFVTSNSFNPSAAGIGAYVLTYTYTDANTCSNFDTASVTVQLCSGIASYEDAVVTVYPNPNNGTFQIAVNNMNAAEMQLTICDVQGKVVYQSTELNIANGFTKEISLDAIANGVYFLKLTTATSMNVYKIIRN